MQKNIIVTLLFAIVIALFAILNAGAVPVNLIFAKVQISAALVILIAASIGAIIVYSIDAIALFKYKKIIKGNEKTIETLTKELDALKASAAAEAEKPVVQATPETPENQA